MEGGIILRNFITRETCAALLYFFYFLVMLLLNAKFKISCLSLGIFFINFFINSGGFFFWLLFGHRFTFWMENFWYWHGDNNWNFMNVITSNGISRPFWFFSFSNNRLKLLCYKILSSKKLRINSIRFYCKIFHNRIFPSCVEYRRGATQLFQRISLWIFNKGKDISGDKVKWKSLYIG